MRARGIGARGIADAGAAPRGTGDALRRLVADVRAEGALPAAAVRDPVPDASDGHGARVAAGPAAAGREADYELLVEAIREGYLLHYDRGRAVAPEDPDLALLAGDQLYALGLARLADLGDLDAVIELADVISLCAQAHAGGEGRLAEPIWAAGARAVGWGPTAAHAAAKGLARMGAPAAETALRTAARDPGGPGAAPGR